MYSDTMNIVRSLLEKSNEDSSTVFVVTITPDGLTANAIFLGNEEQMVRLLVNLIKLADQRLDGKVLKEAVLEAFSKGVINIE